MNVHSNPDIMDYGRDPAHALFTRALLIISAVDIINILDPHCSDSIIEKFRMAACIHVPL